MAKITLKTLSESIDKLAELMLKSFEAVDKRFDAMDDRFDRMDRDFEDVKIRLDNKADKFELKEIDKRVTRVETKLKISTK